MRQHLVLLLFVAVLLVGCGAEAPPLDGLFPQAMDDLELTDLVQGEAALDRVDQLHGKAIDCEQAAIATYQGPDGSQAVIWVSRHDNPAEAREQAAIMLDKMIHPLDGTESPFMNPEKFRYHGVDVYRFQGMGLNHDIYSKNDLVFWISSTPGISGLVLDGLLVD